MPKQAKAFRLSDAAIERLRLLSEEAEMSQTAYLEQLLKADAEKKSIKVSQNVLTNANI